MGTFLDKTKWDVKKLKLGDTEPQIVPGVWIGKWTVHCKVLCVEKVEKLLIS